MTKLTKIVPAVLLLAACSPDGLWCDMPEGCHRPVPGEPGVCEAEPEVIADDCVCPDGLRRYWDCERFTSDAGVDGGS